MKQVKRKTLSGTIVVKTGLHIGAGNDRLEIGGVDAPVIKNPLNGQPYIPGSSIKGKMRSLLEWSDPEKRITPNGDPWDGEPCKCGSCSVCRIFGSGNSGEKKDKEKAKKRGPTRLIIRDAELTDDFKEKFRKSRESILENKSENSINRITAEANPRNMERVVPSAEFKFELVYRVLDTGDGGKEDEDLFNTVIRDGLRLLQEDYLGGGGSRGNGRIEFDLKDENGEPFKL
jgi:CRISPR-associated protein Csm3